MGARLVSLFGTGAWKPVRYRLGDEHVMTAETALMPRAIVELYAQRGRPVTSVVIVGTREASAHYRANFAIEGATYLEAPFQGRFVFDLVEAGERDPDQRQVFQTIVKWLQQGALSNQLLGFREESAPDEIVLDITHGFRAQALIAGAAATFVLAETGRVIGGNPTRAPIRVLYGQYEPGDEQGIADFSAPIWDLTEFVSATLWTLAIQAVRYGRADAADVLAQQESRELVAEYSRLGRTGRQLQVTTYPKSLGMALKLFANDLAFLRARDLITGKTNKSERQDVPEPEAQAKGSARRLGDILKDQGRAAVVERIPVLRGLLDELEGDVDQLTAADLVSAPGVRAMAHLADLYGRIERFAEQAATLREALVTHFALEHVQPPPFIEPGRPGARQDREVIEALVPGWKAAKHENESESAAGIRLLHGEVSEQLVSLLDSARRLRNDMLHASFNDQPASANSLALGLSGLTEGFRHMTGGPGRNKKSDSD